MGNLNIERIAMLACENVQTWGIQVGESLHVISLNANDALFYLFSPKVTLLRLLQLLADFANISGLHLNRNKSMVFPLASLVGLPLTLMLALGLHWEL
ncbi:hypothetical protein NDU88_000989 [Pleurodeles waltl]|uniref:Reverse transcriptase domain-containing protein n=1 Tax=Pleurodeles waltl TaxID=8319 RepID=A0AAV7URJ5_PLEWA|nr:hypothetical protein NDU88_000989 [Pleurodeles waltl]